MLNHVTIMGRLVRDPELRYTQSQIPVTSFTLAVERDFKDGNGEKQVDFIDVTAWRHTAEFISKYFQKGRMAVVHGRLQVQTWTDDKGNKRKNVYVLAESVYFGDSKKESNGNGQGNAGHQSEQSYFDDDDDLPF